MYQSGPINFHFPVVNWAMGSEFARPSQWVPCKTATRRCKEQQAWIGLSTSLPSIAIYKYKRTIRMNIDKTQHIKTPSICLLNKGYDVQLWRSGGQTLQMSNYLPEATSSDSRVWRREDQFKWNPQSQH